LNLGFALALLALPICAAIAIACGGESHTAPPDAGTDSGSSSDGMAGSSSGGSGGSSGASSGSSSGGDVSSSGSSGSSTTPPGVPGCAGVPGSGCTLADGSQGVCSTCGTCVDYATPYGLNCPVSSCASAETLSYCTLSDGSPGACCNGSCVNPETDKNNCNFCGEVCPGTSECSQGSCTAACTASGPMACPSGSVCVGGSYCAHGSCAGVPDGEACTDPSGHFLCCGGACIDATSDPNNCGKCGTKCASGTCGRAAVFVGGGFTVDTVCVPPPLNGKTSCSVKGGCPAGQKCLGSYCVTPLCNAAAPPTLFCAAPDGNVGVCVDDTGTPPFPCEDHPM
jgi:hypothetical protein